MKKSYFLLLTLLVFSLCLNAQVYQAKEFSKSIALYKAKEFVIKEVLTSSNTAVQFQIDPLAAASSGDLTSLVYKCEEQNKEGLVLGLYGNYVTDAGFNYTGFAFKDFPRDKALELLNKIDKAITDNVKFLNKDIDNNDIFFRFDDLALLIYTSSGAFRIRVFWKGFDAEWDETAFYRTKKRLSNKLK